MLVKNCMIKDAITINENDPIIDAIKLLKHHNIGRSPVMQKGKMVGIVTDRDLKRASASDAVPFEVHELLFILSKIKVAEVMSKNPVTVPPDYTVEETAPVHSGSWWDPLQKWLAKGSKRIAPPAMGAPEKVLPVLC